MRAVLLDVGRIPVVVLVGGVNNVEDTAEGQHLVATGDDQVGQVGESRSIVEGANELLDSTGDLIGGLRIAGFLIPVVVGGRYRRVGLDGEDHPFYCGVVGKVPQPRHQIVRRCRAVQLLHALLVGYDKRLRIAVAEGLVGGSRRSWGKAAAADQGGRGRQDFSFQGVGPEAVGPVMAQHLHVVEIRGVHGDGPHLLVLGASTEGDIR